MKTKHQNLKFNKQSIVDLKASVMGTIQGGSWGALLDKIIEDMKEEMSPHIGGNN